MNASAGQVLEELYQTANASDPDAKENVRRVLNMAYFDLAQLASFTALRRSVSIAHGSYLPADLIGVDAVYDADGNYYQARDKSQVKHVAGHDPVLRWYFDDPVVTPEVFQKGISLTKGSNTFAASPALSDTYVGEYMTIGKELGFYKITAAETITPQWMGPTLQGATTFFQIRPEGTRKIKLADADGEDYSATVTVDYWAYPPTIYDESQRILLPTTRALVLSASMRLVRVDLKDRFQAEAIRAEYEDARAELLAANPRYIGPAMPRNRQGNVAGWGSVLTG
jgi:hypothetical protein